MRAALPVRGVCRALLPSLPISLTERTAGTYIDRVCIFSGFDRFVHGYLTSSKRVEVLVPSQKFEDICLKHDLLGEETCKDANRCLQYDLLGDRRTLFNCVRTSKKLLKAATNSERKLSVKARKNLIEQYGMEQFDGVDDSKDSNHTQYEELDSSSSHQNEHFGDDADIPLEVPSSSKSDKTETAIKKKAFQALSARPLTAVQLRKKLLGNHFPPDMVESVITELQASGIQSDYEYAETYSRSRWLSLSWGPNKIKSGMTCTGTMLLLIRNISLCTIVAANDLYDNIVEYI